MEDTYEYIDSYDHDNNYEDTVIFKVDVKTKTIETIKDQTLIAGESNSQYIKFQIPRYYDGIDLSEKHIQVLYIAPSGYTDINKVINARRSDAELIFGWVVPGEALTEAGILAFSLEFAGEKYSLKTRTIEKEICDGMKGSDITPEPVEQEWYIQIQERCTSIMDDVEAAISNIQLSADQIESNKESIEALSEELAELKKTGRDGREDLAGAITEKGVATDASEDMHEMAEKVRQIPSGSEYVIGEAAVVVSLCQTEEYVLPVCGITIEAFTEKLPDAE